MIFLGDGKHEMVLPMARIFWVNLITTSKKNSLVEPPLENHICHDDIMAIICGMSIIGLS